MKTSLFDYRLPKDRIAQAPVRPRDHSRLLVLDRATGTWTHRRFFEIGTFLHRGDLLVINESKVFKARLRGHVPGRGDLPSPSALLRVNSSRGMGRPAQDIELFLLRPDHGHWLALAKPGRKIAAGSVISFADGQSCVVVAKPKDGTAVLDFHAPADDVIAWTDRAGEIPIPPYIKRTPASSDDYQTIYAKTVGSVAAPTAGLHFTPELIERLKTQGVGFASVTLHVGLGTFRPIKTDTVEAHTMHEEWIEVPEETRRLVQETKQAGDRVIAVGTTTVRALESGLSDGFTKLFITPGYRFKTVDALVTNFHLPKSTLLVLVSAFAGEGRKDADWGCKTVLAAYEDAMAQGYRFYSFGDAMLIA